MAKNVLKDLINMDYESLMNLSKKENLDSFKSVLTHMVKGANRRINTLLKSPTGSFSPAYKALKDTNYKKLGINFIKNATSKDTGQLLHLFSVTQRFLKAKSSTLRGWDAIRGGVKKRLGASKMFSKTYTSKSQAYYWRAKEKKFWKLYNQLVDEYGGIITELDSDRIQKMLYRIQTMKIKGKDDDFIRSTMEEYIDKLYRANQKNQRFMDDDFEDEIRIANRIRQQK